MDAISRREFLRLSSITAAATVAAACAGPATPEPTTAPAEPSAIPSTTTPEPTAAETPTEAPTAAPTARFREAPELAELVAKGELPPVEERLPKNPCVCPVMERIGNYGGTIRRAFKGVSDRNGPSKVREEGLTWYNADLSLRANLIESWEIDEDASEWTVHLREGTKWSDGEPFTTKDWVWYWEHQLVNQDLTKAPPDDYSSGTPRVLAELEALDDFSMVFRFADPKPLFAYDATRSAPAVPSHYMQQFHPEFTDKATLEAAAKEMGLETWMDYYNDRNQWWTNPERPDLMPWNPTNLLSSELFTMERNPYFWQVDSDGQQLPYIGTVTHRLYETPDVFNMWIVNGEIDFQARGVEIANYTLFKENEAKGGYRLFLGIAADHKALQLNMTTKEPRLRELFQERNVRLSASYAVNREEMNELAYSGLAKPRQYSPTEQSPQYYPKLSNAYLEYDPDKANTLLDEAGYVERDAQGFRKWKDGSGETISFVIEGTAQAGSPDEDAAQMLCKYLADVGLKATYKYAERSLYTEHFESNQIEAAWWGGDRTVLPIVSPWIFTGTQTDRPWACAWGLWYNSNGTDPNGEEPPEGHWIWDIWDNWEKILVEPDEEKRNELFTNILDIWVEELPMPGYLGQFPQPVIVKNGFRNYVDGSPFDTILTDEHLYNTQTYFWERQEPLASS